ncbi:MAG: DUF4440 domain-containing protein [Spirochaetales bacterium]|nr:DUF4440 domain-containing protein [Spirochaetales bacterium]
MKKLAVAMLALALFAVGAVSAQSKENEMDITVTIGGADFAAVFDENDAVQSIAALFPLSVSMSEWTGNNEYYARLPQKIAVGNAVQPQSFAAGDIALYNGLSLVIFYAATTQTSGYVKVGHIDGTGLKGSLDRANGSVTFSKAELRKSDGKPTAESETEEIRSLYKEMYRAMIAKDMAEMRRIHGDDFVLVHMTGQRMDKGAYLAAVKDGTLNYYSADHDDISVRVDGSRATLCGKSRVSAAVYGGGRRTWRLQQDMTLEKIGDSWQFTHSKASTY